MLYESIRARQEDLINQNPATITISRTTRTQSTDGGYTEDTADLDSQTVRIYASSVRGIRVLSVDDGGYHANRVKKLIAKYDANILSESAINLDTFSYGGKNYKVADVKDIYTQGYIVFKEVYIEETT